jgi:hypothetical protein
MYILYFPYSFLFLFLREIRKASIRAFHREIPVFKEIFCINQQEVCIQICLKTENKQKGETKSDHLIENFSLFKFY